ncbi:hypothetical protein BHE74_00002229, partial [Ensete ventricosum]
AGLAKLIGLARETNDQVSFEGSRYLGARSWSFDEQWRHRESPFLIRIRSASQCILVSEEDEEALTFVDPPLRGRKLAVSTGSGVNGSTLDPSLGEFILTHPDIKVFLNPNYLYQRKAKYTQPMKEMPRIGMGLQLSRQVLLIRIPYHSLIVRYVENCKFPKDGSSLKSQIHWKVFAQ